MRAYQDMLDALHSSATTRSCLLTKKHTVRSLEVYVHSGVYDDVELAYCFIPQLLLKEESVFLFRPVGSYAGLERGIFSKSPKSLLALVRKHLKEQL